jgi:hypothetical protein
MEARVTFELLGLLSGLLSIQHIDQKYGHGGLQILRDMGFLCLRY